MYYQYIWNRGEIHSIIYGSVICFITSPKLKILLIFGIMAVFGLGVSIAIIAIGGGFANPTSIFKPQLIQIYGRLARQFIQEPH